MFFPRNLTVYLKPTCQIIGFNFLQETDYFEYKYFIYCPPLLMFNTEWVDLRELDQEKISPVTNLLKNVICGCSLYVF